jgi:hypothetical protein
MRTEASWGNKMPSMKTIGNESGAGLSIHFSFTAR